MPNQTGRFWPALFRRSREAKTSPRSAKPLAKIDTWSFPFGHETAAGTPVHVVAGDEAWRRTAWMLASWFHFTERTWPLVIHDDGTLTDESAAHLQRLFPPARLIRRKEADAALVPVLLAFPFCESLRRGSPAAMKIFDARHFCAAERYITLDADVLFFRYPREMIDWADGETAGSWFAEGAEEKSRLTPAEARDEFGVRIWPRADAGISLMHQSALDLDFFDTVLGQTSILRGSLENAAGTLAMLGAARQGVGGLLPPSYQVAPARAAAEDAICCHYSGESRARFVEDGIRRVAHHLFPADESRR